MNDTFETGLSIVIPVFRPGKALLELHTQLEASLQSIGRPYEILFVEDCGGDGSWAVIQQLAKDFGRVKGLRLSKNYGQHNAILCGVRAAQYEFIVTMDDDLQNPPNQIANLLAKIEEGFDIVYGVPEKERHGFLRDVASRMTKLSLAFTLGAEVAPYVSAFRIFRTRLRNAFGSYRGPSVSIDILLGWASSLYSYVHVKHDLRKYGASNYTFWKLTKHALNLVTGFGTAPLHLASFLGFTFMIVGFALLCYILVNFFVNGASVPGFAFLASAVSLFSGVQLFALGIFGEYLGRIYTQSMDQPSYFISTETNTPPKELAAVETRSLESKCLTST